MLSAAGRIGHAFLKKDVGVAAATTRLDVYLESKWEWFKQKEVLQSPGELSSSQPRTPIHFQVICGKCQKRMDFTPCALDF